MFLWLNLTPSKSLGVFPTLYSRSVGAGEDSGSRKDEKKRGLGTWVAQTVGVCLLLRS